MTFFSNINLISVFIIGLFLAPIITGLYRRLTDSRIYYSFSALISAVIFVISVAVAVFVADAFFMNYGDNNLTNLFKAAPVIWESIVAQDIFVYGLLLLITLIILNSLLQLLTYPLFKKVIAPLSAKIASRIASANKYVRHLIGGLWQLPKSVCLVLVFSLLFCIYSSVSNNSKLDEYIKASLPYRLIDDNTIDPILSSKPVQQIPVIINSTVDKVVACLSPEGRKLLIKVYINGVTVEDAIKSCPDIDNTAMDIVGSENDDYKKAEIIYAWVCDNISYDKKKAETIETDPFGAPSGTETAFNQKTGICFDKACLYVSMCRAVGVKVRLFTGHAYNGSDWLNHSWNQIYDEKNDRWVNVDTTFGSKNNNYFDRIDFYNDHKDEELQGEW